MAIMKYTPHTRFVETADKAVLLFHSLGVHVLRKETKPVTSTLFDAIHGSVNFFLFP
jgi:hypothetical protein